MTSKVESSYKNSEYTTQQHLIHKEFLLFVYGFNFVFKRQPNSLNWNH